MRASRKILSVVAALTAAATLGACSSSGSGSSGSSTANDTTANSTGGSAASGSPIKVGVICSCSGPLGKAAAAAGKVAQAWGKSVNAAGGINGHPVEVTFKDDASNPGTSVTAAQGMISDGVAVILDATTMDSSWAKAAAEANIPVVGGNLSGELLYSSPNFYPSGQTSDSAAYADILTLKQAGVKNFGQLYCVEAPSCQEGVEPHKEAGKQLGVPLVYNASIAGSAPNYTAQCLAAKKAGAESLFIGHAPDVFSRVAEDCARQGYNPTYVEEGSAFVMKVANTAALKDSLWITFPTVPFFADTPAMQKMNSAMDKYYPGERKNPETFSQFGAQAWTGGLLIEKAVAAAGLSASAPVTAEAVRKGLDSFKGQTLDGLAPPLTFTAGQPHSIKCWFTARVQNGKPALANDGKVSCEDGTS